MISPELYPEIIKAGTFTAVLCLMFSAGLQMAPSHLMYFRDKPLLGNLAGVFRTKILEIEKSSLISNTKLILQYKELNSGPIRGWRT
jgi:hypothetical protein